jgi:O-glycosyl hydrolase
MMTDAQATSDAHASQDEVDLIGSAQPRSNRAQGVMASAYPPPASSTTPSQTDTGEAGRRAW